MHLLAVGSAYLHWVNPNMVVHQTLIGIRLLLDGQRDSPTTEFIMTMESDLNFSIADIEQLEDALHKAMLSGDTDALDEYLDDSLISIDPFGRRLNKQENLDFHRACILKLDRFDLLERSVRLMDNAAAVSWSGKLSGTYYGESFSEKLAYSRVWSLHDGRWTVILIHATRITM